MSPFFADRSDKPGLGLFLNAGDPPLDQLPEVLAVLDERRVGCLELAVPFPDSVTDGPVIRASARRALDHGVDLGATLAVVDRVRPSLRHTRIAVLVDWQHTARHLGPRDLVARVAGSAADGLFLHAAPPRARRPFHDTAVEFGLPNVATCYAGSAGPVVDEAAERGTAYIYIATAPRTGTTTGSAARGLAATMERLRRSGAGCPLAVGVGIRTGSDVARVWSLGADAAIVGTAVVATVEQAINCGQSVPAAIDALIDALLVDAPLVDAPPFNAPPIDGLINALPTGLRIDGPWPGPTATVLQPPSTERQGETEP